MCTQIKCLESISACYERAYRHIERGDLFLQRAEFVVERGRFFHHSKGRILLTQMSGLFKPDVLLEPGTPHIHYELIFFFPLFVSDALPKSNNVKV